MSKSSEKQTLQHSPDFLLGFIQGIIALSEMGVDVNAPRLATALVVTGGGKWSEEDFKGV